LTGAARSCLLGWRLHFITTTKIVLKMEEVTHFITTTKPVQHLLLLRFITSRLYIYYFKVVQDLTGAASNAQVAIDGVSLVGKELRAVTDMLRGEAGKTKKGKNKKKVENKS
jgi:hypothetical protein